MTSKKNLSFSLFLILSVVLSLAWSWSGSDKPKPKANPVPAKSRVSVPAAKTPLAQAPLNDPNQEVAPEDVQKQIQEIIRLNEKMQTQHREQAAELQRIQEQASIHKKILADLEKARSVRAIAVPPDQTELLRQEKLRLIRQQTQENYRFLSHLKESNQKPA